MRTLFLASPFLLLIVIACAGDPVKGPGFIDPSLFPAAERSEAGVEKGELSCWIVGINAEGILINPDRIVSKGTTIKKPFPARDRSKAFFVRGVPSEGLVDGDHFYCFVKPAGTYRYNATDGSVRTVKAFAFVKFGRKSDRGPRQ